MSNFLDFDIRAAALVEEPDKPMPKNILDKVLAIEEHESLGNYLTETLKPMFKYASYYFCFCWANLIPKSGY